MSKDAINEDLERLHRRSKLNDRIERFSFLSGRSGNSEELEELKNFNKRDDKIYIPNRGNINDQMNDWVHMAHGQWKVNHGLNYGRERHVRIKIYMVQFFLFYLVYVFSCVLRHARDR